MWRWSADQAAAILEVPADEVPRQHTRMRLVQAVRGTDHCPRIAPVIWTSKSPSSLVAPVKSQVTEVRRLQTGPGVGNAGNQVTCLQSPLSLMMVTSYGNSHFPVGVKSSPMSCTGPKRYGVWAAP